MKIKLYIFLVILVLIISGCKGPSSYQKKIYDDESLIVDSGDSYYSNNLDISEDNIKTSNFTGSYTIFNKIIENSSNIYINFKCLSSSGKYKIVIIKDNILYKTILLDNIESTYEIEKGNYRIKLVGVNTSLDIEYKIEIR